MKPFTIHKGIAAPLNRENVDTSVVARDTQASTGLYFITHTPQGHVFNYLRAGSAASRLCPEKSSAGLHRRRALVACVWHQPGDQHVCL